MYEKKDNMVRIEFDPENPHPLSAELLEMDRKLALMPDSEIDYSDIPPVTDFSGWRRASDRGHIWLDPDICQWLRGQGGDWQERANAILRREMLASANNHS